MKRQAISLSNRLTERLFRITGHTSDLDEALDEFENVKQAVSELFDANQKLAILNRRLKLTLDYANQTIAIIEADAAMFITPKGRAWIGKYREQYEKLSSAIAQSKGNNILDTQRKEKR